MISFIPNVVGEVLRTGRTFQLMFLVFTGIITYLFFTYGKQGKEYTIRPLEGLEAIFEGIGRCAEMAKPSMILPGIGGLGHPETIAGLTIMGEVAQRSAEVGVTPYTCASSPQTITASEGIFKSAFDAAGKSELYIPGEYVRWYGGDQFAYATGAVGGLLDTKPGLVVHCGRFMFDAIPVMETGARIGAVQVGGTLTSMDIIALFCDYVLISEELYAASATITRDKIAMATLAGEDYIKLTTLAIMVIGGLLMAVGSNAVVNLLGM